MSNSSLSLDETPRELLVRQVEPNVIKRDTVHIHLPTNDVVLHRGGEEIELTADEIWTIAKRLAREVGK